MTRLVVASIFFERKPLPCRMRNQRLKKKTGTSQLKQLLVYKANRTRGKRQQLMSDLELAPIRGLMDFLAKSDRPLRSDSYLQQITEEVLSESKSKESRIRAVTDRIDLPTTPPGLKVKLYYALYRAEPKDNWIRHAQGVAINNSIDLKALPTFCDLLRDSPFNDNERADFIRAAYESGLHSPEFSHDSSRAASGEPALAVFTGF